MKSPNLRSRRPVPGPHFHRSQVSMWGSFPLAPTEVEHGEAWTAAQAEFAQAT